MKRSVVVTARKVFTGTGPAVDRGEVHIQDGTISWIGPSGTGPDCPGAQRAECPEACVIPGLVDTHVHLMFGTGAAPYEEVALNDPAEIMVVRAIENARKHLRSGVTTLRDLGAKDQVAFLARRAAQTVVPDPMPRMLVSGRPITITGGHFWFCGEESDGPFEVRKSVRRLAFEGADVIKIMVTGGGTKNTDRTRASYSLPEVVAVVDEAHRQGLPVSAHCHATEGIRLALKAGVDIIEHCSFFASSGEVDIDMSLVEELASRDVYVSPTSACRSWDLARAERLFSEGDSSITQEYLDYLRFRREGRVKVLRALSEAGVKVVGGTDAVSHFGDYHETFRLYVKSGMRPLEALERITSLAARASYVDDTVGSIETGKAGDLVVLSSDPETDPGALEKVEKVMVGGLWV